MGCRTHGATWGAERLPQEWFAVATPIAVFQATIKHSCAAHGAGTRVVFSLHVLSHSWGLWYGWLCWPTVELGVRVWVTKVGCCALKALYFFFTILLCLGEFLTSVCGVFFKSHKTHSSKKTTWMYVFVGSLWAHMWTDINLIPQPLTVLQKADCSSHPLPCPWTGNSQKESREC